MVEWKKLGEICEIGTGANNREDACDDGLYPFFVRSQEVLRINEYLFNEEAILIPGEGGIGDIFHYFNGKYGLHQRTYRVHPISDSVYGKYIYYYLFANFKCYINKKSYKSTAASIRKPMLTDFPISIPSLSEQQRIVSILDTFTSSISNLKQQIEERRKQYEYERDLLLDLEGKEGVEMKKLEEVVSSDCSLSYGIVQPGDDVADGVPVVRPVDLISNYVKLDGLKKTERLISESYKRTILKGNEILFCVRGTTGIMGLATNELKGCNVTRGIVPISFDDEITKMFVYYQLKCFRLQKVIDEKTNGTALKQINIKDLRLLNLFFPPLSTQSRIVSILDTFEQSIANLEEQLAMREKQYEYYRNQLLTFEGEEERGKT